MKRQWLEKMAADGMIRPSVLDKIYQDCEGLKKIAASPETVQKFDQYLKAAFKPDMIATGLSTAIGFVGLDMLGKKLTDMSNRREERKNTVLLGQQIASVKIPLIAKFPQDKEKASARFDEIMKIAPLLITKPEFVEKLIATKLNSGFTSDDFYRLIALQSSMTSDRSKPAVKTASLGDRFGAIWNATKNMGDIAGKQLKRVAPFMALGAGVSLAGGAASVIGKKLQQRDIQKELDRSFAEMMHGDSENSELIRNNIDRAREAFKTVAHFSPHVALNPIAAKGVVTKILQFDADRTGMDVGDLKTLSEIQNNINRSGSNAFLSGVDAVQKMTGADKILSRVPQDD